MVKSNRENMVRRLVDCPRCGVQKGESCKSPSTDEYYDGPHAEREEKYNDKEEKLSDVREWIEIDMAGVHEELENGELDKSIDEVIKVLKEVREKVNNI